MFDHAWTRDSLRPVIETCLDQFGPSRCMFGSNFPVDSLYSDYAAVLAAHAAIVPEPAQGAVFHDTAARFYNLP